MNPELLLLIGISFSLGFAPGPNNAVASSSAFNFGIRKTIPVILGVGFGYTTLVILLIYVLISIFEKYPYLIEIIRILGSIFLLYLAYKISFSKKGTKSENQNPSCFDACGRSRDDFCGILTAQTSRFFFALKKSMFFQARALKNIEKP